MERTLQSATLARIANAERRPERIVRRGKRTLTLANRRTLAAFVRGLTGGA